ncbi:hypothetical protein ACHQM5_014507 [Ranunculus cassubicifolius]
MAFCFEAKTSLSKLFSCVFAIFLLNGFPAGAGQGIPMIIGAITNTNNRIGREQKVAMDIAIQDFNKLPNNKYMLELKAVDSGGQPLRASTAAAELIKENKVQAIVGTGTWLEAALVTEVANKAHVPVISFATPSISPSLSSARWPFMVRMANNDSAQMKCVASVIGSYGWRRVIVISEDDGYSTDSGALTLLTNALEEVGSEIEQWLAFPPFSTLSNPKTFIAEELKKLGNDQSRVFIMVQTSLELSIQVFNQAKHVGLMGKDSVWIATDSVASLLDTVRSSDMSSMQGIIGITTYFSETTPSFKDFSTTFRGIFQSTYPKEEKYEPGFHALRAFDTIFTIALAMEKLGNNKSGANPGLLASILSSNFNGLSGKIQFEDRELSRFTPYEIVNVVGKSYISLKYWSAEYGFSDKITDGAAGDKYIGQGALDRVPVGWVMPSEENRLLIGIPGRTSFEKFVKVIDGDRPTGFCIDVFDEALKLLPYALPYQFVPVNCSYDDLVQKVYNKFVEFTQPFAESGLTMLAPVKQEDNTWFIAEPFTKELWLGLTGLFLYVMFSLWFLEYRSSPEFRGPFKNQLSNAVWFTSTTIFFAHRDSLRSNYTRVVIFVWLFTVFVVTSSYTASLTSILTVKHLTPKVSDIDTLRKSNSNIGCDGDSFVQNYLEQVLHFPRKNIINISSEYEYPAAFKNGTIQAAFLELPYERVFLSRNAKNYQEVGLKHRFGGLGFVFPKGSPLARDFSDAFLKLSEDGTLNKIDKKWFPSLSSSKDDNNTSNQSLGFSNFWALFLVTGITCTIMVVFYTVQLCTKFRRAPILPVSSMSDDSVWKGFKRFGSYYVSHSQNDPMTIIISSNEEHLDANIQQGPHSSPITDIEMETTDHRDTSNHQPRILRVAYSFPGAVGQIRMN